jgi:phage replication-related protein YjqB (UPF0714/DUF867 family)
MKNNHNRLVVQVTLLTQTYLVLYYPATISIHGAKGDDQIVFLGGAKSDLRDAIQSQLESRGFAVQVPPEYLGGLNEDNFINKNENSTGVQLEQIDTLMETNYFHFFVMLYSYLD